MLIFNGFIGYGKILVNSENEEKVSLL